MGIVIKNKNLRESSGFSVILKLYSRESGIYNGWFTIDFHGNLTEEGVDYPEGRLIMPISEDLKIYVK
jgi:hypothetical protein